LTRGAAAVSIIEIPIIALFRRMIDIIITADNAAVCRLIGEGVATIANRTYLIIVTYAGIAVYYYTKNDFAETRS